MSKLSFGNQLQSRKDTDATEEVSLDTVAVIGDSENALVFTTRDQGAEDHPS